jgi:hypothetical protein
MSHKLSSNVIDASEAVTDPRLEKMRREAETLSPILASLRARYDHGTLLASDLVGSFILAYLSVRRPSARWASGRLPKPVIDTSAGRTVKILNYNSIPAINDASNSANNRPLTSDPENPSILVVHSKSLCDLPELASLIPEAFAKKWFGSASYTISLFEIFNTTRFTGIRKNTDDLVNHSIAQWMAGDRPFELLFHIPSPMEVLRMQADGRRVVSMLATLEDLGRFHFARLTYMAGAKLAEKDAFDFLIHDLTHMEHFVLYISYREQVGFMKSMLGICGGKPRKLFSTILFPRDKSIWSELEYLISDM